MPLQIYDSVCGRMKSCQSLIEIFKSTESKNFGQMCKYSSYFHLLWDLLCKSFLQIGYFCKSHITIYSHLQNIIQCKSHKRYHLVSPLFFFPNQGLFETLMQTKTFKVNWRHYYSKDTYYYCYLSCYFSIYPWKTMAMPLQTYFQ